MLHNLTFCENIFQQLLVKMKTEQADLWSSESVFLCDMWAGVESDKEAGLDCSVQEQLSFARRLARCRGMDGTEEGRPYTAGLRWGEEQAPRQAAALGGVGFLPVHWLPCRDTLKGPMESRWQQLGEEQDVGRRPGRPGWKEGLFIPRFRCFS